MSPTRGEKKSLKPPRRCNSIWFWPSCLRCFSLDPQRPLWILQRERLHPSIASLAHDVGSHMPSTSTNKHVSYPAVQSYTNGSSCLQCHQRYISRCMTTYVWHDPHCLHHLQCQQMQNPAKNLEDKVCQNYNLESWVFDELLLLMLAQSQQKLCW